MNIEKILKEISFKAVRSGGPGGQHANKVSSKVILLFDIRLSQAISVYEREIMLQKLEGRLNNQKELILTCGETRSQHRNKEIVTNRFLSIINGTLKKTKKRIPTKVSKGAKARRLEAKKKLGHKKSLRQKPKWN